MVLRDDYDDNVGFLLADSIFPNVELLDAAITDIARATAWRGPCESKQICCGHSLSANAFDIKNLIDIENEGQ